MRAQAAGLRIVLVLCGAQACTAFNECQETAGSVVGYTAVDLELRASLVRYQEAPIGNLVADSFYDTARDNCGGGVECPDIAVENAGAIRSFAETGCSQKDVIGAGPIQDTDVRSILPFATNHNVQVALTARDLRVMLEHAVDRLGEAATTDVNGWFLQVSHLRFTVDCDGQRQLVDATGTQVLQVGSRVVLAEVRRDTAGGPVWEAVDFNDTTRVYQVVTNSFIGAARDGHLAFAQRDAENRVLLDGNGDTRLNPRRVLTDSGVPYNDAHAVERFVRVRSQLGEEVAPLVEGRITLLRSCFRRAM